MNFTWDKVGNLTSRDNDGGYNNFVTETFLYDELDRLTTATNENFNSFVDIHYNNLGSINYKSDIGTYQYEEAQPQAVSSINGTNTISKLLQTISYTSFNKIYDIEEDEYKLHFTYGINHERKLTSLYKDLQLSSYKYFASGGMYEEEHINGITRKIHYISGGGGIFATYEITEDENGSENKYNYLLKDHIGSTVGIVDDNGLLVEKYSYDAWGKRRNPQTWMPFEEQPTFNFKRGFTGHEHLDEFALINMNGRVYDPTIGAFLSPDPFISNPYYSQSLNRYAYVGNNPLSAIDPSGYWSINNFTKNDMVGWLRTGSEIAMYVAAGVAGGPGAVAFVAFGMNTLNAMEAGSDYSSALGAGIQAAAFSYLTANFSTAVGFINLPGGEAGQAVLGAIAHGIVQGSMSAMQGGRFESGFFAGAVGSIAGSFGTFRGNQEVQLTVAVVLGGTASVLGGGKFANGAVSAAFVVMFNHWGYHSFRKQLAAYIRNTRYFGGNSTTPNPFCGAVAISGDIGGSLVGAEKDFGGIFIIAGEDAGEFVSFSELAGGAAPDGSVSVEFARIDFSGNANVFKKDYLFGERTKGWFGAGLVLGGNVGFAISKVGDYSVTATSVSIGVALSPITISFGLNIGEIKPW
jgi:RHS repeat-associated protein